MSTEVQLRSINFFLFRTWLLKNFLTSSLTCMAKQKQSIANRMKEMMVNPLNLTESAMVAL